MLRVLGTETCFSKAHELLFKLAQLADPLCNMADVLIKQFIDLSAILRRGVFEPKQHPNFIQGHVQPPAMPNEGQPLCVLITVDAVIAVTAPWRRQQTFALIKPDGFDLGVRTLSQFADFHVHVLQKFINAWWYFA